MADDTTNRGQQYRIRVNINEGPDVVAAYEDALWGVC